MVDSNLHVVTHEEEGWAIKREGVATPLSTHSTQKEAINAALDVAQDEETSVIVHRRDGRIREVKSFNGSEDGNGNGANTQTQPAAQRRTTTTTGLSSLGSRIRWGAVLAGFFISLATSLALTTLGMAIALSLSNVISADALRVFVGVWVSLTLLASLFLGGLIISRLTVNESDIVEPAVYGALLWSLVFFVLPLLPMGAANIGFGNYAGQQQSNQPAMTQEQLMEAGLDEEQAATVAQMANPEGNVASWVSGNAAEIAWLSFVAMLVSLAAAIGGALVGASMDEDHLKTRRRVATARTA